MARKLSIESQVKRLRCRAFNEQLNKPIATIPIPKKKLTPKELVSRIESEVRKPINPLKATLKDKINFENEKNTEDLFSHIHGNGSYIGIRFKTNHKLFSN